MLITVASKSVADMHKFISAIPLRGRSALLILFESDIEESHQFLLTCNMVQGLIRGIIELFKLERMFKIIQA